MSVKIITDSASDVLTPYHPAVSVLPMTITFGDQQYRDKEELSSIINKLNNIQGVYQVVRATGK